MPIRIFFRQISQVENIEDETASSEEEEDHVDQGNNMEEDSLLELLQAHTVTWNVTASERVNTCAICLDDIETGQIATRLPCFHMYHAECIQGWVKHSASSACPDCQHDVSQITTIRESSPPQTRTASPEHH